MAKKSSRKPKNARKTTRKNSRKVQKPKAPRRSRRNFNIFLLEESVKKSRPFVATLRFTGKTEAGNASDKTWQLVGQGGKLKTVWGPTGGTMQSKAISKADAVRRVEQKIASGYNLVSIH